LPPKCVVVNFD